MMLNSSYTLSAAVVYSPNSDSKLYHADIRSATLVMLTIRGSTQDIETNQETQISYSIITVAFSSLYSSS
jgi:hypothetical protein